MASSRDQGVQVDYETEPSISHAPGDYQLEFLITYPLLNNIQTNSVQNAQALPNENQYGQVQQRDQTLYQPSASTYVQSLAPDKNEDQDSGDDDNQPACRRRYRDNY
ncbi:hypothetical protein K493DRAFT_309101 [Basidiobolus meristosporus CBS 931.73]|uniref:Uncharacterized protein n=1 Tax=Basidiobolus meristosporus CBS 931.73 TaxID=1314790 RepID=A0A1Y1WS17_9FUNG|nr:hypothetical protein K493DRAFT_309101 [Basidiobolus meristosporus CBS 931.73]|eukprot:ORX75914.1 hypothetical protein K493DRAFT_309101 [Basidiobolus meristosporus CBS 931.73]